MRAIVRVTRPQGIITGQFAAWAAILAVPTAIAGIYGMNFANMPELKTDYGYFVVLGVIVLLCGLYLRFKKARWLSGALNRTLGDRTSSNDEYDRDRRIQEERRHRIESAANEIDSVAIRKGTNFASLSAKTHDANFPEMRPAAGERRTIFARVGQCRHRGGRPAGHAVAID
jgi:hypothetical protein